MVLSLTSYIIHVGSSKKIGRAQAQKNGSHCAATRRKFHRSAFFFLTNTANSTQTSDIYTQTPTVYN